MIAVCSHIDDIEELLFEGIEVNITHDPGCMYTKNGDGWPASTDIEIVPGTVNVPVSVSLFDALIRHECHQLCRVTRYNGPRSTKHDDPDEVMEHEVTAKLVGSLLTSEGAVAMYDLTG